MNHFSRKIKPPIVYIRVATKEQLLSPARNVRVTHTNKSFAVAKQLLKAKYDYQSLSKVHSLIKEKFMTYNSQA